MRGFGVKVDAPPCSSIAAANSLILINVVQESRRLRWIDDILDCNQNWPKVGGMLLEHAWFTPMIPCTEINRRARKPKGELQEQGRANSDPGNEEGRASICVFCGNAPKGAAYCHAALKYKKIGCQHTCANPVGRQGLNHRIKKRHKYRPASASEKHQGT